jgi:hypothetical protein
MNAVERLRQMSKIQKALENEDFGELAIALGMTGEIFDNLPMEELIEIITVRMNDILKGAKGE